LKHLSLLHKISVSFLYIILSVPASGGNPYNYSSGAAETGMGKLCITHIGFSSSLQNQALLAENKAYCLGFTYENRFSLGELGTRSAAVIVPAGKASIAAIYSTYGYSDFKRSMSGIACGLKLSDKIDAGVQADYFNERIAGDYSNNQAVTFEAGLIIKPKENVFIGFHLFNPLPQSLRKYYLPSTLTIGAGTIINKTLFAGIETEISTGGKLTLRTGFEYQTVQKIVLRGGFCSENNSFGFGLGYLAKTIQFDIGFQTHDRLGITSCVSIIFKFR
jgi:hypothetical protein